MKTRGGGTDPDVGDQEQLYGKDGITNESWKWGVSREVEAVLPALWNSRARSQGSWEAVVGLGLGSRDWWVLTSTFYPPRHLLTCCLRVGSPEAGPETKIHVNVIAWRWGKSVTATVARRCLKTSKQSWQLHRNSWTYYKVIDSREDRVRMGETTRHFCKIILGCQAPATVHFCVV